MHVREGPYETSLEKDDQRVYTSQDVITHLGFELMNMAFRQYIIRGKI